jgi:hypothetical protein
MIRIIIRQVNTGDVAFGGAPSAPVTFRTFDVSVPSVEVWLRQKMGDYITREVVGVELLDEEVQS